MSRLHIIKNANFLLNKLGYNIGINKIYRNVDLRKVRLNLGSGDWSDKGWTNLDYSSEWYSKVQKKHKIVPYDIRNDDIPLGNNSVNSIYCSHVIEHIEDKHINRMFKECYRVLESGGVLRITCPDAEFLYNVSKKIPIIGDGVLPGFRQLITSGKHRREQSITS